MARKKEASSTAPVATTEESTPTERRIGVTQEVIEVAEKNDSDAGTTEQLFSDFNSDKKEPSTNPKESEVKEVVESSPEPTEPEEIFLEDILEKNKIPIEKLKSRIKVDEKEDVIPYSELRRRVQLNEHLNRVAQDIGRQRRELAEERKRIQTERDNTVNRQKPDVSEPVDNGEDLSSRPDPIIDALIKKVIALEQRTETLNPVIFENNRQRVAKEMKSEGFDDFLDYIPKMESHLASLKDDSLIEYYDTDIGSKALYLKLKSQDLLQERKNSTSSKTKESSPVKDRNELPVVKMDSGQQPSSMSSDDIDDYSSKYQKLLTRWKQNRDPNDFRELLRLQGALQK